MNRLTYIEIAGTEYPLNFSTKAGKMVASRYGGLEKVGDAFSGKSAVEAMDEIVWLLSTLIEQGIAYKKIVDNEDAKSLTADELEVVLGMSDIASLKDKIMTSMTAGMKQTVEVETDPKNGETTQGE